MPIHHAGKVSLGKATEIAGLSVSAMIDLLTQYGVSANLEYDDYLQSLQNVQEVWYVGCVRPSLPKASARTGGDWTGGFSCTTWPAQRFAQDTLA